MRLITVYVIGYLDIPIAASSSALTSRSFYEAWACKPGKTGEEPNPFSKDLPKGFGFLDWRNHTEIATSKIYRIAQRWDFDVKLMHICKVRAGSSCVGSGSGTPPPLNENP